MTAKPAVHQEQAREAHIHPGASVYAPVAIILAILTGLEILVYYLNVAPVVLVPVVIILGLANIVLSALFYMHLRYDDPVLKSMFSFAGLLASLLMISLLLLFGYIFHHMWIVEPFARITLR
jgi:cytochrome c oxidase subunit IV